MGSAKHKSLSATLYKKLRRRDVLYGAWKHVCDAGRRSTSPETLQQINEFLQDQHRNIERIQEELRENRFRFDASLGIAKKRPGKSPRPIVIGTIRNRVVQRAILDVLQSVPSIRGAFLEIETSFGGIEDRSVSHAIGKTKDAISKGARYYARSDIRDFFRCIPRDKALALLEPHITDNAFRQILREATTTELSNLTQLKEHAHLFPLDDIGVAQGCALSTLVGNALLRDFDAELNQRGNVCLRYIDDFIILGAKPEYVHKAFNRALGILKELDLTAYDPWDGSSSGKSARGFIDEGFEFLGCDIQQKNGTTLIVPSERKQRDFLARVDDFLTQSERAMRSPPVAYHNRMGFVPTLQKLSNMIEGWGKKLQILQRRYGVSTHSKRDRCSN